MAQKITITDFQTYDVNKDKAELFLTTEFATFTDPEKNTWVTNSRFNTPIAQKDPTGIFEFKHYFMSAFGNTTNSNITYFATTDLAAGTSNNFVDRATRLPWVTT